MRKPNRLVQFGLILGASCGAMALGGQLAANVAGGTSDFYAPLETFSQVLFRVQHNYVEERPAEELIEGAIEGMLSTLDPFSLYLSKDEYRAFQEDTRGEYYGIGVQINEEADALVVVVAFPGQPADQAGLKAGDRILKVDGEEVARIGAEEAIARIRGRKGTNVILSVKRSDGTLADLPVTRDEIHTPSVQSRLLEPGFGFVRLTQFQDGSAADVRDAIKKMISDNKAGLSGLILDLRGNPGGLLDEAVKLVDLFVEDGIIVSTRGRAEEDIERARHAGTLEPMELIVLVDGGSASASEIVAGALQDLKRATIAGEPSYGKGSVQNIFPMADQSALRLTVAKYYTPSGRPIDRVNPVMPDVEIAGAMTEDGYPVEIALEWLEEGALSQALSGDAQVQSALKLLRERVAALPPGPQSP